MSCLFYILKPQDATIQSLFYTLLFKVVQYLWVNVNVVLAQDLQKPMIKRFRRKKVYARFKDDIWAVDLAEMRSLSSFNCSVKYLLCVIDVLQ